MRRGLVLAMGAAGAAGAFAAWTRVGRTPPSVPVELELEAHAFCGKDVGAGSLVAVQPHVVASDYAAPERLLQKLDGYLADAKDKGAISDKSVVVLPEHLATWLVATGEKRAVYERADMSAAAALIVARNLPSFVRHLFRSSAEDAAAYALFRCKADDVAKAWTYIGSTLARRYGVTLVAGSALLPQPRVNDGELILGDGALRHVSLVFSPDGALAGEPVAKSVLGPDERGFVEAGDVDVLPSFETPAGRLGVLIGRDAFQPTAHAALLRHGVELVAVPAYLAGEQAWTRPWSGFVGNGAPADVMVDDEGRLLEAEAWLRWGPPYRLMQSGARAQVTAFLKGRVWDRASDGAVLTTLEKQSSPGPLVAGGSWVCQWLSARE